MHCKKRKYKQIKNTNKQFENNTKHLKLQATEQT